MRKRGIERLRKRVYEKERAIVGDKDSETERAGVQMRASERARDRETERERARETDRQTVKERQREIPRPKSNCQFVVLQVKFSEYEQLWFYNE